MSDINKLRSLVREEIKSIMAEKQAEGGMKKLDVRLPAQAQKFLDKAVSAIKGANLNRRKQIAALAKIIDGLGLDRKELVKYIITQKPGDLDPHMRPQTLLFDYKIQNNTIFKIEESEKISQKLKEYGFKNEFVNFDKDILKHNDKKIDMDENETIYNKDYTFFKEMKNVVPKYKYFYNDELRNLVYNYYYNDFNLLNY